MGGVEVLATGVYPSVPHLRQVVILVVVSLAVADSPSAFTRLELARVVAANAVEPAGDN